MATNEADLGGRLFPGGEAQRSLTPDSTLTIQLPESEVGTLESTTIPMPIPPTEAPPNRFDRRGLLKIGLGVAAAAGATALGRIIIPGLSSDGDGSGDGGGSGSQPIQTGETPTAQVTQSPAETATPSPTKTHEVVSTVTPEKEYDPNSLRGLASKIGKNIGISFSGENYKNPNWQNIATNQFNQGTVEWGIDWTESEPKKGAFNFSLAQNQFDIAKKDGMRTRGHALVYPSILPDWVKNGDFTKDELIEIMQNHVTNLVKKFEGTVDEWVVVNEPNLIANPRRPKDIFFETIGEDYIDKAFEAARAADPSAKLIFNEANNHSSSGLNTNDTRRIVERLKGKGLIDAVGLQMHLDGLRPPSTSDVIATMQSYGVPVLVTEFDVNMQDVVDTPENRTTRQAQIYKSMLGAALDSKSCDSFTLWVVGDKFSFLEKRGQPNADPTAFDDNFNPKPAFYALQERLQTEVAKKS